MRLLAVAITTMLTALAFLFFVPTADASACGTDTTPDDNGVGATCTYNGATYSCGVLAYGQLSPPRCSPPIIVCVREPCP